MFEIIFMGNIEFFKIIKNGQNESYIKFKSEMSLKVTLMGVWKNLNKMSNFKY